APPLRLLPDVHRRTARAPQGDRRRRAAPDARSRIRRTGVASRLAAHLCRQRARGGALSTARLRAGGRRARSHPRRRRVPQSEPLVAAGRRVAAAARQAGAMRCAIMQPTYMPWAGYLSLMDAVDLFVYLDDAQYERATWQNRNRVLVDGKVC